MVQYLNLLISEFLCTFEKTFTLVFISNIKNFMHKSSLTIAC